MSATEEHIDRRNDTLTIVGSTYCISTLAKYATQIPHDDGQLSVVVQMIEADARALLAGLQEALA